MTKPATKPTKRRVKKAPSEAKKNQAKKNGLGAWRQACVKHGYMVKGGAFKPVPKKGTAEYKKIRATFDEIKSKA